MAIDGLIPRKTLFGNPDKASPQISPNGEYITFLAPVNGVLNIWLAKSTDPHSAIPITEDSDRGIRFYGWTYTNEHIAYIQDIGGDENWHVYVVNINNHETKDLTPYDGVQARFQEISPKFPNDLLLALNDRDPQLHDVYKVNLDTGDRTLVQQNDGFAGYITDDNFDVRFATRVTEDGGSELLQKEEDSTWKSFIQIGIEDTLTTSPIG